MKTTTKKTAAKKKTKLAQPIYLVLVKGDFEFGGIDNLMNEYLIEFGITNLPQSDPVFLDELKHLVVFYAFNFFDMDFDESKRLLKKAKTLEEIEAIAKSIKYDGYDKFKMTYGIEIIEIKNTKILKGLKHLEENFFESDYGVNEKIKKLKKNKKFKEALELKEAFNELSELVEDNQLKQINHMKYTTEQIEKLKDFAQKKVNEHNESVRYNLQRAYGRASREEYKILEKETDEFIKRNTLKDMLEVIVEWGEDNEIPFDDLEDEFENCFDWEGHDFPEIYI